MGRMEDAAPLNEQTPVTGVVISTYSGAAPQTERVVVVEQDENSEDYLPACIATALLGPIGLCGTAVVCPSDHGCLGASVGCGYWNIWRGMLLVTAFLLAYFGLINCNSGMLPTDFSFSDCQEMNGTWAPALNASTPEDPVPMGCFNACPTSLQLVHTDTPWHNFTEFCEEIDPTCTGLGQYQFIFNLASSLLFGALALHFAMVFARRIEAARQARAQQANARV